MSLTVRVWLTFLLAALLGYTAYSGYRIYSEAHAYQNDITTGSLLTDTSVIPGPQPSIRDLGDLTFTERSGQPLSLKSLDNQVWIAGFFFASCPGYCRQLNADVAHLVRDLARQDVKIVSFTVDPENDTPQVLAEYAKGFQADPQRWLFVTGKLDDVGRVCRDVFAMDVGPKVHTERLVLVDRAGRRRGVFSTKVPAEMIALKKGVEKLLAEPIQPPAQQAASLPSAGKEQP